MKHPFYALIVPMPFPVDPPDPPTGGPPGIWGPTDPRPSNPIQLPPWAGQPQPPWPPTGGPPGIWGPNDPRPSNPIPIYPGGSPVPPGWQPPTGQPPRPWDPAYPSQPIPIYPGGSPTPPWWWGQGGGGGIGSGGRPMPPYPDIGGPPPQPPVVIPPGELPGGEGRDYAIIVMPGAPPIELTPGPGEKPEVGEGGEVVLVWNGEWVWHTTPPPPPGYNPPTGSGAPPSVATPVSRSKR